MVPDTQLAGRRPAALVRHMLQEAACTSAAAPGKLAQRQARRPPLLVRNDDDGDHHRREHDLSYARVRDRDDRGAYLGPPPPWCQEAHTQAARNTAKENNNCL